MAMSVGTAVGYLDLDTSKFQNGLKTAAQQLSGFTDSTQSVGNRVTSLGEGLKTVGQNMTKYISVPLIGIGTASVATAANFEKSMSNVAALSGATGKDLEDLTNIAKEMGATTQFSASEAADALGYMALAGWKTEESMSALPGILDLAAASNMGLAEASDMVTDYLSAFQQEADQAGRMADVLAYAQANSNTTTQALGEAFKNCAVNANSFGLDIEQTTALLGKLGDQGLKGSEAGTALNAVFRDMSSKMKDGAIAIGDTNVKITDANGNFKSMAEIVGAVQKATDGLSDSEKMVALQSTFTADSIKAMSILMNTGSDSITEFTNELYNSKGAASEMAGVMNDNLSGQLTALKSALEGAAISIGNALLPVIKTLVSFIQNLVNWFNGLNPTIQTTIVVIGGIVAAIGPVLLIVGQMCTAIGSLITFFSAGGAAATALGGTIALLTGPVGIAIGAITALIAAGVLLISNWDNIKSFLLNCLEAIRSGIDGAFSWICQKLGADSEQIKSIISEAWNQSKQIIHNLTENIRSIISTAFENIKKCIDESVGAAFNVIKDTFERIRGALQVAGMAINQLIQGDWEGAKKTISIAVDMAKNAIRDGWNKMVEIVKNLGSNILNSVKSAWENTKSAISSAMSAIRNVVSNAWNNLKSATQTACSNIAKIAGTVFNGIAGDIGKALSNAWNTAKGWWDKIKSIFSNPIKAVVNIFKNEKSKALENENLRTNSILDNNDTDFSNINFNYNKASRANLSNKIASNEVVFSAMDKFKNTNTNIANESKDYDKFIDKINNIKREIVVPLNINGKEFARVIAEYTDVESGQRISFTERGLVL